MPVPTQIISPDIVLVAALFEEFKYIFNASDWTDQHEPADLPPYKLRKLPQGTVVAISPDTMGLVDMAMLCGRILTHWKPSLVIMVGICAGRETKNAHIGHLIIPKMSFHYQFGAYRDGKIEREIKSAHASENLVLQAKNFAQNRNILGEIRNNAQKSGITVSPYAVELHTDPMGSADLVVKDENKIKEAIEADRKVIAIDMESYAFIHSAHKAKVESLVIKSVSDHANNEKEAQASYREYAKFISCQFAWKFVEYYLEIDNRTNKNTVPDSLNSKTSDPPVSGEPDTASVEGSGADEVTRFAVEVVRRAEARLEPSLRPQKHSRWAGEYRRARYYRLWYQRAPWHSDQFRFQLWLESGSRQIRTLWVGFSMRPKWLDENGYPADVAVDIRGIMDAYANKHSIALLEASGIVGINYEIPAPALTESVICIATDRLCSLITDITPAIEAVFQNTKETRQEAKEGSVAESEHRGGNVRIQLQQRAQAGRLDSRTITEVLGVSSNWVSNARKENSLKRPTLEYILDGRGVPMTAKDGRFLYKLDHVLEFIDAFEKWVSDRENITGILPLLSVFDDRIENQQLLTMQNIVELENMPKNFTTLKNRLAPPVGFCISSAGQGYSLLFPKEQLERLRQQ